jgi:hypothetical protein
MFASAPAGQQPSLWFAAVIGGKEHWILQLAALPVVTFEVQAFPSSHAVHGVAVPASQVSPAPESITPSPH